MQHFVCLDSQEIEREKIAQGKLTLYRIPFVFPWYIQVKMEGKEKGICFFLFLFHFPFLCFPSKALSCVWLQGKSGERKISEKEREKESPLGFFLTFTRLAESIIGGIFLTIFTPVFLSYLLFFVTKPE